MADRAALLRKLSQAAATEWDDRKRASKFVFATEALNREWWESSHWQDKRRASKIGALEEFKEQHAAFATQFTRTWDKFTNVKLDANQLDSLRQLQHKPGSEEYNEYATNKYHPELKLIGPLITQHRSQIQPSLGARGTASLSARRSFMFVKFDAQLQPCAFIHEASEVTAHPVVKNDEKFKTYVRTYDKTRFLPVYVWYSAKCSGLAMIHELPWALDTPSVSKSAPVVPSKSSATDIAQTSEVRPNAITVSTLNAPSSASWDENMPDAAAAASVPSVESKSKSTEKSNADDASTVSNDASASV